MTTPAITLAVAAVIASTVVVVSSDARADARTGELFAQRWCSQCHAVKPNQLSPKPQTPRFSDLARDPAVNEHWLRTSLRTTPHRGMPKIKLKPKDLDDIVSYILSLR
jgi:mono/diheme cytochrome c family protein